MLYLLLAVLLLWVLAGLALFLWGAHTPRPGARPLVHTCDRRLAYANSEVTARLWPGARAPSSDERPVGHYRVVLVFDHSSEMGSGPGSPLARAVGAAVSFAENVTSETCHVGVVGIGGQARTLRPPGSSKAAVVEALRSVAPGGGAGIGPGLRQAGVLFDETTCPPSGARRLVLLLSDGGGDAQAAAQAAQHLKERGVHIVAVACGAGADETVLRRLASGADDYFHTLDPAGLVRLYDIFSPPPETAPARHAFVEESVDTKRFLLSDAGQSAHHEFRLNEGRVRWFVPSCASPAGGLVYRVVPTRPGWHRIAPRPATVETAGAEGSSPSRGHSNDSPYLLVLPAGWWPGLALLFNPLFWLIWNGLRGEGEPHELAPAPPRGELAQPDVQPVTPSLPSAAGAALKPALVIGVGFTGSLVLRALRYQLEQLNPRPGGALRFLWLDTGTDSPADLSESAPFGAPIPEDDCVLMPDNVLPLFRRLRGEERPPEHLAWLDVERARARLVARDYDLSRGTLRRRLLGRAAFYQHIEGGPDARLRRALDERLLSLGRHYRVFVVGHTGGGTAGGTLLDLLIFLHKRIRQLKQEVASVDGLLLTHHMLDDDALEPILSRNTVAFTTELSRHTIRRHLPLSVAQTPQEAGAPVEITDLLDRILVLERPLEAPSDRTRWPGPVTHSAAETLLQLLLDEGRGASAFLDGDTAAARGLERASGQTVMYGAGITSRWLPLKEARRLITTRTLLDFLSRDLLPLSLAGEEPAPAHDPSEPQRARENVAALVQGSGLKRPPPVLLAALPALADPAAAPAELARLLRQLDAYPGLKGGVTADVGGDGLLAEVLDVQQELFAAGVEEWALRILNGEQGADGTFDPGARRGAFPRLASAAEHLASLCADCLTNLDAQAHGLASGRDRLRFQFVRHTLARYSAVASSLRRDVSALSDSLLALAGRVRREAVSARQQMQAVRDELSPYAVWSEEIAGRLLERYCDPARERLLGQVQWVTQSSAPGTLRLALRVRGRADAFFHGGADEVPALLRTLSELIPDLELSRGLELHREDLGQYVALERWLGAERADPVKVDNNAQAALAGRPFSRHEFVMLAAETPVASGLPLTPVRSAYPYRASVLRLLSGCALFAASALCDHRRLFPRDLRAELPFLNPVDRLAAAHEDRLSDLGISTAALCPAIRTYFRDQESLRAFALAHALGLLRPRVGSAGEALFLNGVRLTAERPDPDYPVLLEALDNFVVLKRTAAGTPFDHAAAVREVGAALAERDAESLRRITRGLSGRTPAYLEACPPAVRSDFLKLAELFLDLELRRRGDASEARREAS
ncbi:MAG TPA: tubulin-like doman-containing protein [Pyrinomonadaceae bacterium]|nr:tubulin-like doman-containing protein [Pyrinomonadaceae bacterium]